MASHARFLEFAAARKQQQRERVKTTALVTQWLIGDGYRSSIANSLIGAELLYMEYGNYLAENNLLFDNVISVDAFLEALRKLGYPVVNSRNPDRKLWMVAGLYKSAFRHVPKYTHTAEDSDLLALASAVCADQAVTKTA